MKQSIRRICERSVRAQSLWNKVNKVNLVNKVNFLCSSLALLNSHKCCHLLDNVFHILLSIKKEPDSLNQYKMPAQFISLLGHSPYIHIRGETLLRRPSNNSQLDE